MLPNILLSTLYSWLEMKKASAHFNIQKWLEGKKPLTPIISIKTYLQNFEMAILFKIVRQSENYVFEDTPP